MLVISITYHIFNVIIFIRVSPVQINIQSTQDEVAVILVFHQLLHPADFQPANSQPIEYTRDDFFEELLIFTVRGGFQFDTLLPHQVPLSTDETGLHRLSPMLD